MSTRKQQSADAWADEKDFYKAVHMLIELLGRDMESANPLRERELLVAVRDGLFRTEVAGQLFSLIRSFRELLTKHFPEVASVPFNANRHIELAKKAAKLAVQPMGGRATIYDFLRDFGVDMGNTQMAIFAITQFIEMVRNLPMKFFSEQDHRLQTIAALQHELDRLIVIEESEEVEDAE
ncbi:MAG: hypothetical protein LBR91_01740 [Puniceicoccales bacterium]|nr:hypothetical protein [Puniceicoccales bacterium]